MAWTTYQFYIDSFLMGDTAAAVIPDVSFPRVAAKAERAINWKNVVFPDNFVAPDYLQLCVCEVAELLYMSEKSASQRAAGISSFSNDGYSVSYDTKSEDDIKQQISGIRKKHLNDTALHNEFIFAGW